MKMPQRQNLMSFQRVQNSVTVKCVSLGNLNYAVLKFAKTVKIIQISFRTLFKDSQLILLF